MQRPRRVHGPTCWRLSSATALAFVVTVTTSCITTSMATSDWFWDTCIPDEDCAPGVAALAVGELVAAGLMIAIIHAVTSDSGEVDDEEEVAVAHEADPEEKDAMDAEQTRASSPDPPPSPDAPTPRPPPRPRPNDWPSWP